MINTNVRLLFSLVSIDLLFCHFDFFVISKCENFLLRGRHDSNPRPHTPSDLVNKVILDKVRVKIGNINHE
jgi:uncharacterized protein YehS (DUF1456 family)